MASSDVDDCMDLQFEFRLAVWNNFFFRVELNFLSQIFLTECVYEYIYMYIYFFFPATETFATISFENWPYIPCSKCSTI